MLHGRSVTYAEAGDGPVVVLIHGMGGGGATWRNVIEPLAQRHTVIIPNLPGHGGSALGGDYSPGGLASGVHDLLLHLGYQRATLGGHSHGGGIALQFAYQYPDVVERLVLVSSGGLGSEVNPFPRLASLPGAGWFIAATAWPVRRIGPLVDHIRGPGQLRNRIAEIAYQYGLLADRERRAAFLEMLRSVMGLRGQRLSALEFLPYLAEAMPILIIWGRDDPLIPVWHGEHAHRVLPGSRLEIFDGVGHLPQLEAPAAFLDVLERFLADTEPPT